MYSLFLNLEEEKRRTIINAALKEFSTNTYDLASTNKIVKQAVISKGILFHYFGSKKNLYLFLNEYVTEIFADALNTRLNWQEPDIFKRYEQIVEIKFQLMKQYHNLFDFLKMVYAETSTDVRQELNEYNLTLQKKSYETVFEGIDFTLFKEHIDVKKAIDTIQWVTDGINQRYDQQLKAHVNDENAFNNLLEQCAAEANSYFLFLKQLLYK
ncbi:TetR/AcrR family transcriptional regulator [Solibacillus sp. CAU 1738]|uniref:TetR/AcrR family transcriptional regulator n=1 Tax=Solibacillus sp. CAU 1738 TaxID=3140363 RepID=UPI003260C332